MRHTLFSLYFTVRWLPHRSRFANLTNVQLSVETFTCGPLANNIYLVIDHATSAFVVIDPSIESSPALQRALQLRDSGLRLQAIWNTHGHFDHIFDNHL